MVDVSIFWGQVGVLKGPLVSSRYNFRGWSAACSEGRCRAKLPALRCCFAFGKVPESGRIKLEVLGIFGGPRHEMTTYINFNLVNLEVKHNYLFTG